jgi:hypothetical protein
VDDAPIAPLNQLENELYGSTVYTIIGHRLEFTGMCPTCAGKVDARSPQAGSQLDRKIREHLKN